MNWKKPEEANAKGVILAAHYPEGSGKIKYETAYCHNGQWITEDGGRPITLKAWCYTYEFELVLQLGQQQGIDETNKMWREHEATKPATVVKDTSDLKWVRDTLNGLVVREDEVGTMTMLASDVSDVVGKLDTLINEAPNA